MQLKVNKNSEILEKMFDYIYLILQWLLFNVNSAIFQLYHGENKLIFIEMMMRSALYYTNSLDGFV